MIWVQFLTSIVAGAWNTGLVTTGGNTNGCGGRDAALLVVGSGHLDVDIIALGFIGEGCIGVCGDVKANCDPCRKKAQYATCHKWPFGGIVTYNGTINVDIQLHVY